MAVPYTYREKTSPENIVEERALQRAYAGRLLRAEITGNYKSVPVSLDFAMYLTTFSSAAESAVTSHVELKSSCCSNPPASLEEDLKRHFLEQNAAVNDRVLYA